MERRDVCAACEGRWRVCPTVCVCLRPIQIWYASLRAILGRMSVLVSPTHDSPHIYIELFTRVDPCILNLEIHILITQKK